MIYESTRPSQRRKIVAYNALCGILCAPSEARVWPEVRRRHKSGGYTTVLAYAEARWRKRCTCASRLAADYAKEGLLTIHEIELHVAAHAEAYKVQMLAGVHVIDLLNDDRVAEYIEAVGDLVNG